RRVEEKLGARAVYLPNPGWQKPGNKTWKTPPDIIWVSSHGEAYAEYCEAAAGISAAARKIRARMIMVGRFSEPIKRVAPGAQYVSWIEPARFGRFLAEGSFLAAAPMPIMLD